MLKKIVVTFLIFSKLYVCFGGAYVYALSDDEILEYEVKAAMIEKIIFFVDWPPLESLKQDDDFILGLYAQQDVVDIFNEYYSNKKLNNKTVKVLSIGTVEHPGLCDAIFMTDIDKEQLAEIMLNVDGKATLLFSENKGFDKKGVHVNFFIYNRKVRFTVNLTTTKQAGFEINSLLLNYAKRVIRD